MKLKEIETCLKENGIDLARCKIDDHHFVPGCYYLFFDGELWNAFLFDKESEISKFSSEEEACNHYLKLVFSNPMMFLSFTLTDYFKLEEKGRLLVSKYCF